MLNADREPMYWMSNKDWYKINKEEDTFELTEKAPERAIKSFEMWKRINKKG